MIYMCKGKSYLYIIFSSATCYKYSTFLFYIYQKYNFEMNLITWVHAKKKRVRKGNEDSTQQCWVAARCIPSSLFTSIHTVNKSMEALTLGI